MENVRTVSKPNGAGSQDPPSGVRALDQPGGGALDKPGGRVLVPPAGRAAAPSQAGGRDADPSSTDKRSEMSADDTNSSVHDIQQVKIFLPFKN
jgi:hypothetical protein